MYTTQDMKQKIISAVKANAILADTLGVLMVIIGVLIGPLPGPGFVPMFFGGLGLLSIHHPPIARFRDYLLKDGNDFIEKFFPEHRTIMILWDVAVVIGLSIGAYAIFGLGGVIGTGLSVGGITSSFIVFAKNRKRLDRYNEQRRAKKTRKH